MITGMTTGSDGERWITLTTGRKIKLPGLYDVTTSADFEGLIIKGSVVPGHELEGLYSALLLKDLMNYDIEVSFTIKREMP
jgi:hypothetical protein